MEDDNNVTVDSVLTAAGWLRQATMYDGFGLPVISLTGPDDGIVASRTDYDGVDRPVCQWNPVVLDSNVTAFTADALEVYPSKIADIYGLAERPFVSTRYRQLPGQGQPISVTNQSADAQTDPTVISYEANNKHVALLCVPVIKLSADGTTLTRSGLYEPGMLEVVRTTTPDNNVTLTFTDWRGRVVMERRLQSASVTNTIDTYYIYDAWGNRRAVIPPGEMSRLSADGKSIHADEGTVYRYSYNNRLLPASVEIPSGGRTDMTYDCAGRLAYSQDADQRGRGVKTFCLYDTAGRLTLTGECDELSALPPDNSPMLARLSATTAGIDSTRYVTTARLVNPAVYTANYYDSYDRLGAISDFDGLTARFTSAPSPRALLTASLTAVWSGESAGTMAGRRRIATIYGYDTEERVATEMSTTPFTHQPVVLHQTQYAANDRPTAETYTLLTKEGTEMRSVKYQYTFDRYDHPLSTYLSGTGIDGRLAAV